MKNPILLSIIIPVLLIGAAAIFSNKTYRVERTISATPEEVWAVLMDTAAYGEWNPVFIKVEGSYAAGGTVLNTFKDPSGKLYDVTNKVEALESNRLLRQKGGFTGVLTFDHQWLLEPVEGGTKVTQYEIDRGVYVWFWDDSWIVPKYTEVLQALEREVARRK
jgi:uncharacterized protein YndB with AHSA1/START domain